MIEPEPTGLASHLPYLALGAALILLVALIVVGVRSAQGKGQQYPILLNLLGGAAVLSLGLSSLALFASQMEGAPIDADALAASTANAPATESNGEFLVPPMATPDHCSEFRRLIGALQGMSDQVIAEVRGQRIAGPFTTDVLDQLRSAQPYRSPRVNFFHEDWRGDIDVIIYPNSNRVRHTISLARSGLTLEKADSILAEFGECFRKSEWAVAPLSRSVMDDVRRMKYTKNSTRRGAHFGEDMEFRLWEQWAQPGFYQLAINFGGRERYIEVEAVRR